MSPRYKVGERDRLLAAAQTWRRRALLAEDRIQAAREDQQAKINSLEHEAVDLHKRLRALAKRNVELAGKGDPLCAGCTTQEHCPVHDDEACVIEGAQ